MGRIIDIIILAFGINWIFPCADVDRYLFTFVYSVWIYLKSDHKTGTKLFADMTGKQKVSLVLIAIGLIPYIDVIIPLAYG
jgi:hypothetical protein